MAWVARLKKLLVAFQNKGKCYLTGAARLLNKTSSFEDPT